jgi:hypothetical protein
MLKKSQESGSHYIRQVENNQISYGLSFKTEPVSKILHLKSKSG